MMKKCTSPPTAEQSVNYENKSIHLLCLCTGTRTTIHLVPVYQSSCKKQCISSPALPVD